jgi:hypothetical protein
MVVTAYASVPDVRDVITPDLKCGGDVFADAAPGGVLVHVAICGAEAHRLGGSVLAQVYSQLGATVPDLDAAALSALAAAFVTTQALIGAHAVSSGHDVSDGGLATTLLEMAFAGNCGIDVTLPAAAPGDAHGALNVLFAEEPGLVLEFATDALAEEALAKCVRVFRFASPRLRSAVCGRAKRQRRRRRATFLPFGTHPTPTTHARTRARTAATRYAAVSVHAYKIGTSVPRGAAGAAASRVTINVGDAVAIDAEMVALRDVWEATSFALEMRQVRAPRRAFAAADAPPSCGCPHPSS